MSTFRKERMGEAIRKVVVEKMMREGSLVPNALITINKVEMSPDFSYARIFYSVFGPVSEEEAASVLDEQRSAYRYEIAQKLNARHTPKVEFIFDRNTEHAFRIDGLLKNSEQSEV